MGWPDALVVFVGTGIGTPKPMTVILTHDQSFVEAVKHTQVTLAPGAFTISGLSYHADDPNCCPRYIPGRPRRGRTGSSSWGHANVGWRRPCGPPAADRDAGPDVT